MAIITSKSLEDWNTLQLDKWKELEPNINTNSDSMVSMDANVISEVAYLLEQDLITQTNNAFLAYAIGDELSNLGIDRGIPRKEATKSTGIVTFSRAIATNVDYTITAGTIIGTTEDTTGNILTFQTTADGTLYGIVDNPVGLGYVNSSTGGSINNGTRIYTVTAKSMDGTETTISNTVTSVISNGLSTNKVTLNWTASARAQSYNIYLGGFLLGNSLTATYIDLVGTTASIIAPPVTNLTGGTSIDIAIESTGTGLIYNVSKGAISKLIETPVGIETVTNNLGTSGGSDREDDDVFRSRIQYTLTNNYGKTTVAGYASTALAVNGVANATVVHEVGNPANDISVFIVAVGSNPIPSGTLIAQVQAEMDLDENRAVCDSITVKAPTTTAINVSMNIISYSTDYTTVTLADLIEATLDSYFASVGVGGIVRVVDIANAIYSLDAVIDFALLTPTTNTTLTATQIAIAGTITINFI